MTDESDFTNLTEEPLVALARVSKQQPASTEAVRAAYLRGAEENHRTDMQMLAAIEQADALVNKEAPADEVYEAMRRAGVHLDRASFTLPMAQKIVTDLRNHLVATKDDYIAIEAEAAAFVAGLDRNVDGLITDAEIRNSSASLRDSIDAIREVEEMSAPPAPTVPATPKPPAPQARPRTAQG